MSTAPVATCPTCGGAWLPAHPAGPLTFRHTVGCETGAAEDRTKVTDAERVRRGTLERPATDTERRLLAHLGYAVPDALDTLVQRPSPGIIRRTWPTLTRPHTG